MEHPGDFNTHRISSAELRERERMFSSYYDDLRRAAEVHRQTRQWVQSWVRPGIKLIDMCRRLEACVQRLVEAKVIFTLSSKARVEKVLIWAISTFCRELKQDVLSRLAARSTTLRRTTPPTRAMRPFSPMTMSARHVFCALFRVSESSYSVCE